MGHAALSLTNSHDAPSDSPKDMARRVLVVDDEDTIRAAISRFLGTRGYEVDAAGSGAEALELLRGSRYALMLCDVRMPGMSGIDLLQQAVAADATLATVMLTAVNDAPTATQALARGAYDYLVKPVELAELHRAVERALHRRTLRLERQRVEELIRDEVAARTEELEREKEALSALTVSIAQALVNAMEAKSIYLRGHSQRVAELAASIADAMGLDPDTVEAVRLAGRLQDVGKIGIRDEVLNKPGALTREEYEHVKSHVRLGVEILSPLKRLGVVLDYVQDHHERYDGTGYPRGLAGDSISIGGRILAAADAFNALTSLRAYRDPKSPREAVEYLRGMVGSLLDPAVYAALREVVMSGKVLLYLEDVGRG
jgi:putative nucleotidyltransferase with HDIG domain